MRLDWYLELIATSYKFISFVKLSNQYCRFILYKCWLIFFKINFAYNLVFLILPLPTKILVLSSLVYVEWKNYTHPTNNHVLKKFWIPMLFQRKIKIQSGSAPSHSLGKVYNHLKKMKIDSSDFESINCHLTKDVNFPLSPEAFPNHFLVSLRSFTSMIIESQLASQMSFIVEKIWPTLPSKYQRYELMSPIQGGGLEKCRIIGIRFL